MFHYKKISGKIKRRFKRKSDFERKFRTEPIFGGGNMTRGDKSSKFSNVLNDKKMSESPKTGFWRFLKHHHPNKFFIYFSKRRRTCVFYAPISLTLTLTLTLTFQLLTAVLLLAADYSFFRNHGQKIRLNTPPGGGK